MIVMKSVRGPAIYDYTNGYSITVGELQQIGTSSGHLVVIKAVTSSEFDFQAISFSGNVVTVKAMDLSSGSIVATSSANLASVEIAVVADGW